MRILRGLRILALTFLAFAANAQTDGPVEIPLDTPLDEIVCEKDGMVDTCWSLGWDLMEADRARAAKVMELSCALRSQTVGCYEAGKIYLLDKQHVNYDLAYDLFEVTCYAGRDPGFGPYGCKYLGHMEQLGLGRPSNVVRGHEILIRACFTHNDSLADQEGCDLLAKSYLFGFDTQARGRSPQALSLAFISYARGCLEVAPSLCEEGQAFLEANRANPVLVAFLEECDAELAQIEGEDRVCAEVFVRPGFLPRGYAGARSYEFRNNFIQFWRVQFARLEPDAAL